MAITPALPPGFELEDDEAPPLPPGFVADDEKGLDIDIVGGTRESQLPIRPNFDELPVSQYQRYLAGVGGSMVDGAQGLWQAVVDKGVQGAEFAEPLLARIDPEKAKQAGDKFRNYRDELRQDVADRRASTPGVTEDPSFGFGNIVGTAGQLLLPGMAARGTAFSRAILPTTVRGNALQGLAFGGVQPVAAEGERETNSTIGGVLGGALPAALKTGGGFINSLRGLFGGNTMSGAERGAGQVLRDEATNLASLLKPSPSAVPGVQRTLAEESMDPGISGLERMLRGREPGQFAPVDLSNNAARTRSLEAIAGTDADMAAAEAARNSATSTARQEAMAAGDVDTSQTLQLLDDAIKGQEGRPAVQTALRQVRQLLATESEDAPGLVTTTPESRIQVLDNVRMTIGDMLSGKYGGESAAALKGSRELIAVRDALNDEIAGQVPRFGDYLNAYRQGSVPINRMEVGRDLLQRGSGAVPDAQGNNTILPAKFLNATQDLDSLAAKATGFGKAKAQDILTPKDIAAIRAIQDDMQRVSVRNTSATVGSPTDAYQEFGRRTAKSAVQSVPVVGRFAEMLEQSANQRVQNQLAYLVAHPAEARRVLAALNAKDRAVVSRALLQVSGAGGAAVPALAE